MADPHRDDHDASGRLTASGGLHDSVGTVGNERRPAGDARSYATTDGTGNDTADGSDPATTAALVGRLGEQISSLLRDEVALAKVEVEVAAKRAGIGAGLFGAAGVLGHYGGAVLLAAIVLALALVLPAWLSALIVALVLFVIAGVAALMGKKKVATATAPLDTSTRNVQADVDAVKAGASS